MKENVLFISSKRKKYVFYKWPGAKSCSKIQGYLSRKVKEKGILSHGWISIHNYLPIWVCVLMHVILKNFNFRNFSRAVSWH